MRRLPAIVLCAGLVGLGAAQAGGGSSFFNGKDLSGWEGKPELWSVKDGAVVGSTFPDGIKANTFLVSKQTYTDFELRFQVRLLEGKGNSGIQFRSKVVDEKGFVVAGPQADIGAGYWGSLYGERFGGMMKQSPPDKVKSVVHPTEFNDYSIRCVGQHVTIKVNGETMVDDDFEKLPPEGIIAFQAHAGGPMEVTYKDIRFTDLRKGGK